MLVDTIGAVWFSRKAFTSSGHWGYIYTLLYAVFFAMAVLDASAHRWVF